MGKALLIISDAMEEAGINYQFGEWTGDLVYPYWVGEYQEIPPMNEDGMQETDFMLNGFARDADVDAYVALERAKAKIQKAFPKVEGKVVIADDGSAVAIFYANSLVISTGDAELKRLQINLKVKEWSVN